PAPPAGGSPADRAAGMLGRRSGADGRRDGQRFLAVCRVQRLLLARSGSGRRADSDGVTTGSWLLAPGSWLDAGQAASRTDRIPTRSQEPGARSIAEGA